jgi:hypothetical protein
MSALPLAVLAVLFCLVLVGSRRLALASLMAGMLYLSTAESLVVAGFALYPMRALEVAAAIRIFLRKELSGLQFGRLDRLFLLLYAFTTIVFVLRSSEGVTFQLGVGVDALLQYFAFRCLISSLDDLRWLMRTLVIMLVPFTILVVIESFTFQNTFAVLGAKGLIGGEMWVRNGRLRAIGSFGHPSLLGTVGGALLPIFMGLWFARPSQRFTALVGIVLCLGIVGAANSGAPVICVATAVIGWMLWPMRRSMHIVRRSIVAFLVVMALVMNAPIWYLLARISDLSGGGGYHRAVLLDVAFQNLDKWWLAGMPLRDTSHWLPYTNSLTGVVDMTNNFLSFGVTAGLGAVFLYVALLTVAYKALGSAMGRLREEPSPDENVEPIYWGLGVAVTVHIVNWFGITYWDQTSSLWYLHLAIIGSLAARQASETPAAEPQLAR